MWDTATKPAEIRPLVCFRGPGFKLNFIFWKKPNHTDLRIETP